MTFKLVISTRAEKDFARIDKRTALRIVSAIRALQTNFGESDIKKLAGRLDEYRLRVGEWRVLFEVEKKDTIVVTRVLNRKDAYRN